MHHTTRSYRCCGKTVVAWCGNIGISTKTYYYRLKRVCAAIPEDSNTRRLPAARKEEPVFAELEPVEQVAQRKAAMLRAVSRIS